MLFHDEQINSLLIDEQALTFQGAMVWRTE